MAKNLINHDIKEAYGFMLHSRVVVATYNGHMKRTNLRHGEIIGFRHKPAFRGSKSTDTLALVLFDEGYARWTKSMSNMDHACVCR